MHKLYLLIYILIFLSACSESDKGLNFSDKYQQTLGEIIQQSVSTGCSFSDVDFEKTSKKYDTDTESQISELLSKYVTPLDIDSYDNNVSGQVNYLAWLVNKADKEKLCDVIQQFNNTDPGNFSRNKKLSFYINAYNIFTIELILRNYFNLDKGEDRDLEKYPDQKSIKNIDGLGSEVWNAFAWKVGSENLSLNNIEKDILIPMGDARIHFAVNCASKGCPPLRNEAFTEDIIDEQLDEMSTFFVTSPAYNSIILLDEEYDPENGDNFYEISSIFKWYKADFENDTSGRYGSVQKFITYHLDKTDEELGFPKEDLENTDIWFEDFSPYNWELNEVND